jgi:conjugative transfer signal peptidase TraF
LSIASVTCYGGPSSGRHEGKARRRRRTLLATMVFGLLMLTWPKAYVPSLLWNGSSSIPIGLYALTNGIAARGQLAVVRLPNATKLLARARGYLPASGWLIKPVVAGSGNTVCRHGQIIRISGRLRALAHRRDTRQRLLPRWHGCHHLTAAEVFVLSTVPGSFDSRYFGPVERGNVIGTAIPIWTR